MNRDEIMSFLSADSNPRGQQVEIGPSEIGGCRRAVWHRIQQTPVVNPPRYRLAGNMGTAIHNWIERQIQMHDPFRERYLTEVEIEVDGLTGHADVYDTWDGTVIDWKTITKKKVLYFPSSQQRMQVQLYGWLLTQTGYPVNDVMLVGIPRDGNEDNVVIHAEPYDEATALYGLKWLQEVREATEKPEPEQARRFCQTYCVYYDPTDEIGCRGGK